MKKIRTTLILFVLVLTLTGCSNNTEIKSAKQANATIENNNYGKTLSVDSKKATYLSKMNSLENQLDNELAYLDNGITADVIESTGVKYKSWDNMLNQILDILKKQLSEGEMEDLMKKQVQWISYRENTARSESGPYEEGPLGITVYNNSLTKITKERCYELVNNYMK